MKIRKPRKGDEIDLAELDKQFWEVHENLDPLIKPSKKLTKAVHMKTAKFIINSKKKNDFNLVAFDDGKILGAINFKVKKNDSFFRIKKYGYINVVTVNKKFRRKGVARKLIESALEFFKKRSINYVKLKVDKNNLSALKAWEKLGFKPQDTTFIKQIK